MAIAANTLTLKIIPAAGGPAMLLQGWTEIRVTRSIERCPNDFEISMTEIFPGENDNVVIQPGDGCQVFLGPDLVITGWIDKYEIDISATQHRIRVCGRGKCQDIVDSSAEWPGSQIRGTSALDIAEKLAAPYGIKVSALGDPGIAPIITLILNLGETAYELIERVCRNAGLLVYEDTGGNVVLARTGTLRAACGFTMGVNILHARSELAMDQRFSEYDVFLNSVVPFLQVPGAEAANSSTVIKDQGVLRHRRKAIICEQGTAGLAVTNLRAQWEMTRRVARGVQVRVTTDTWRDSANKLWEPNTLVPIDAPALKLPPGQEDWLIGDVTYRLGEEGTIAELVLMPPAAFTPQPINLLLNNADLQLAATNLRNPNAPVSVDQGGSGKILAGLPDAPTMEEIGNKLFINSIDLANTLIPALK